MDAPPDYVIEAARLAAVQSPCAKSKRGVVLFNPEDAERDVLHLSTTERIAFQASHVLISSAFNGPPAPYECKASDACRAACRDICLHAEQRALLAAIDREITPVRRRLELVHVKVTNGIVVPGGGPSCLQCSRLVVEVQLRGVWLYELAGLESRWCFYSAKMFHEATLAYHGLSALGEDV